MAEQGYNPEAIGSFHHKMMPWLANNLVQVNHDDLIVDIGAAQGHGIIPLKRSGYSNISVVDIDTYNFEMFKNRYQFNCHQCDVENDFLPFDNNSVGWTINFHLIEHLNNPNHFLNEVFRVLKPGGSVTLVTPDWRKQYKTFYRDPTHIHPYDKVSIGRLLRMAGFVSIRTFSWGSRYGLGRLQGFRWHPAFGMIGNDLLALAHKE